MPTISVVRERFSMVLLFREVMMYPSVALCTIILTSSHQDSFQQSIFYPQVFSCWLGYLTDSVGPDPARSRFARRVIASGTPV